MRFSSAIAGLAAVSASGAYAQQGKTIKVTVGADKKFLYSPNDITAEVGDKIEFDFFPANHTVTQSSFADPCHPLSGGFFSGFVPTKDSPSGTSFTITVKDTKPIWFYCSQGKHCQMGMVGSVNAPKEGNTLAKFTELASKASNSTAPPSGPVGGELHQGNTNSSQTGGASQTSQASKTYTSTWTSDGTAHTTTVVIVAPPAAQTTSWAYTTKPYTSTWTKDGQTFTSTATTTLFSVVTETPTGGSGGTGAAATTTSATAGAAGLGAPAKVAAVGAGAVALAAAAMF